MISFVTSLYKSEAHLAKYIRRVKKMATRLKKAGVLYEFIVIANEPGSQEKKLLAGLPAGDNFKAVEVPRETLYASWNRGVSLSRGEMIGFWNVDDHRYAGAVAAGVNLLKNNDLVYFPFFIVWSLNFFGVRLPVKFKLAQPPKFNQAEFCRGMCIGPFFMFNRDFYHRVGPFDEQFFTSGDMDWAIRAAKISDKFVLAKNIAGVFKVDGQGLSAGGNERQIAENNIIYKRYGVDDKVVNVNTDL